MKLRGVLPPRLALRIALVGIAQMVVIAIGFWAILEATRPSPRGPIETSARDLATAIEPSLGDPKNVPERLRELAGERTSVTIVDPSGSVVASTEEGAPRCTGRLHPPPGARPFELPLPPIGPPPGALPLGPPPPGPPPMGARGEAGGPPMLCAIVPIAFPSGDGQLHYLAMPPPPPSLAPRIVALVLLVVGVSSVLLAWSLVRPLRKLSSAARAFGAGDVTARASIDRGDELGDVSRAFDDMAERVTQLLRAEKELIANISHELRTPLARIRVAVDLAAEGDTEVAHEALGEIAEDLDELERLIADVLTAARLDLATSGPSTGLPPLRSEAFDGREIVRQAAARFEAAHTDRRLVVTVTQDEAMLDGDRVLLRRVIDNLLENAHKYTEDPEAPIHLTAKVEGDAVLIEVVDRGIGIGASDLPNVFRPFYRADKSRTRSTGGLGLGLALAKRIVDAHGGSLDLESSEGEGTLARVTLPLRATTSGAGSAVG